MNQLQRKALASVPLTKECVESFYDGTHSGTLGQCLKALCASHERLRAELEGAEKLLEESGIWSKESDATPKNPPCHLALECARSIANYCLTRFPCDTPPHALLDIPWFAEKVQRCIDEATAIGLRMKRQIESAIALTDTGSDAFREAFPPNPNAPSNHVPGWRVVEKIREVLLGSM